MTTELETSQEVEIASTEEEEVSEETTEELAEEPKPEKPAEKLAPEVESRIRSEAQKMVNTYREKRESDTALIRSLQGQITELKGSQSVAKLSKAMSAILESDEEEGFEEDKIEAKRKDYEEIKTAIKEYRGNIAKVEEAVQFIDKMTEKLSPKIVEDFGLDDANPNVRAANGAKLLSETAAVYKYSQNFLMVIEDFLPKGDELREQIEDIIDGMSEFKDDKSKKLYLKDKKQGVKVTPRKKPQIPSDIAGGGNLEGLSDKDLMRKAYSKK